MNSKIKPTQDHIPEHATDEEKDAFLRTIFPDPINKWRGLILDVHGDFFGSQTAASHYVLKPQSP
jgi:hypothetical protein